MLGYLVEMELITVRLSRHYSFPSLLSAICQVFQRHQKSSHLLSSLMAEVPPQNRRTISTGMLAVEILPPLTEIISPVFRPVRMLTVPYLYRIRHEFTRSVYISSSMDSVNICRWAPSCTQQGRSSSWLTLWTPWSPTTLPITRRGGLMDSTPMYWNREWIHSVMVVHILGFCTESKGPIQSCSDSANPSANPSL